jgi:hypothetical protein
MNNMNFLPRLTPLQHQKLELREILLLSFIGIVGQLLLIANPGYFSHDEWQRFDSYLNNGLYSYIIQHIQIHTGTTFGTPVRPISFALQGIHNLFFQNYPFIVHLISAINTILVSLFICFGCINYGLEKRTSLVAGALFITSPLTALATGWSAALMDQLYFTFGLIALYSALIYVFNENRGFLTLVAVTASGTLSFLSKETGIIFPASLAMVLILWPNSLVTRWPRFLLVFAAWTFPILIYLLYRISAIETSFTGSTDDPYRASVSHIGKNLFVYWVYPFHPRIGEANGWVFQSPWSLWLSFAIHSLLVTALAKRYGFRSALFYMVSYFLFLAPVILLPNQGSHYMFASAAPLSIVMALLVANKGNLLKIFCITSILILLWHGIAFQKQIYKTGRCMSKIATSLEAHHASAGFPSDIYFTSDTDAQTHILLRLIHGRNQVGSHRDVNFHPPALNQQTPKNSLILNLDDQCILSVLDTRISVDDFGPQFTREGVNPNIQPGGGMGLWIKIERTQGLSNAQVYFDSKPAMGTTVGKGIVTAEIDPKMFAKPGRYLITLKIPSRSEFQEIGYFEVTAPK